MKSEIEDIKRAFIEELKNTASSTDLNNLRIKYLGKKGILSLKLRILSELPPDERPIFGQQINECKRFVEEEIKNRDSFLRSEERKKSIAKEYVDITLPGKYVVPGRLHPVTQVMNEIVDIFTGMGFDVEVGPEVELDYYNFEALNIPKDHPARDMQDTFYISDDILLRTHTSPVQVRVMERKRPPLKFIAPGKVYRCDADISHTPMFHQVEGLMVDKGIAFSDLKGILEVFIHKLFNTDTPVRFRPSYFPFTEPSVEIDIGCILCLGKGCRVCKDTGWLEVLGAGMVNPRVFEMVGYDPEENTGFAFGMGVERLAMLKYSIEDIRMFFENDIRFLRQF